MEIVLYVEQKNFEKLKQKLFGDNIVSRANLLTHEAQSFGKEGGFYIRVLGDEEECKRALELSKDLGVEVTGEEREMVLKKLYEESERSLEGFGGIFG
ncbi:MAG: hypothetical protein N3F64_00965 [Nitrososphaeria archaeon]|nr:hypothetical protein [Nitrososphaeria archaeon]